MEGCHLDEEAHVPLYPKDDIVAHRRWNDKLDDMVQREKECHKQIENACKNRGGIQRLAVKKSP